MNVLLNLHLRRVQDWSPYYGLASNVLLRFYAYEQKMTLEYEPKVYLYFLI